MQIYQASVDDLKPYEHNPKQHPRYQIESLMLSIREFGFIQPIVVDEENVLLIGHGRLQAAKELKLDSVPVLKIVGLTAKRKLALRIADNKLAEKAIWDVDLLKINFNELIEDSFALELTGFAQTEIDAILDSSNVTVDGLDADPVEDLSEEIKGDKPKKFTMLLDKKRYKEFIDKLNDLQNAFELESHASVLLKLVDEQCNQHT